MLSSIIAWQIYRNQLAGANRDPWRFVRRTIHMQQRVSDHFHKRNAKMCVELRTWLKNIGILQMIAWHECRREFQSVFC
jgi:hypothetical protein